VELGVPFPKNRYGEYIGYKTDHDPRRRATSVGPYTSKCMTECLQASVEAKGIKVFDNMQVVRVLSDGERAYGLLCLRLDVPGEYAAFSKMWSLPLAALRVCTPTAYFQTVTLAQQGWPLRLACRAKT